MIKTPTATSLFGKPMLDDDDIKPIMFFIILMTLIGFLWGYVIGANKKVDVESFTMLSAVNSPVFMKTQVLGTVLIKDNVVYGEASHSTLALAEAIIQCESNGRMVYGDLHLNPPSYGVAQFRPATWKWMKEQSGMKDLDYYSEADQRTLLIWAIENGLQEHWTCYGKIAQL